MVTKCCGAFLVGIAPVLCGRCTACGQLPAAEPEAVTNLTLASIDVVITPTCPADTVRLMQDGQVVGVVHVQP